MLKLKLQYFGHLWMGHTLDAKSQSIGKDSDVRKDWRREEKGAIEGEMVEQHHQLSEHKSEQTPGMVKDRETWHAAVYGVTKSQTHLSTEQHQWSLICILFILL